MTAAPIQTTAFAERCAAAGLDIVHSFAVQWWNDRAPPEQHLPAFGRTSCLGLLVGNTRHLWPRFRQALVSGAADRATRDPLDAYTVDTVTAAAATLPAASRLLWAHVTQPRAIPIQRIAETAGLAHLSPSHLSIHPVVGPWLALRAIVIVDSPGPHPRPEMPVSPCTACPRPCLPELQRALADDTWQAWLRVRDACPEGRAHRYDEPQVAYHYSKDKTALE